MASPFRLSGERRLKYTGLLCIIESLNRAGQHATADRLTGLLGVHPRTTQRLVTGVMEAGELEEVQIGQEVVYRPTPKGRAATGLEIAIEQT